MALNVGIACVIMRLGGLPPRHPDQGNARMIWYYHEAARKTKAELPWSSEDGLGPRTLTSDDLRKPKSVLAVEHASSALGRPISLPCTSD